MRNVYEFCGKSWTLNDELLHSANRFMILGHVQTCRIGPESSVFIATYLMSCSDSLQPNDRWSVGRVWQLKCRLIRDFPGLSIKRSSNREHKWEKHVRKQWNGFTHFYLEIILQAEIMSSACCDPNCPEYVSWTLPFLFSSLCSIIKMLSITGKMLFFITYAQNHTSQCFHKTYQVELIPKTYQAFFYSLNISETKQKQ